MIRFRLVGRDTEFKLVKRYNSGTGPGAIHCVHGVTPDGKHETRARLSDVILLGDQVEAASELAKQDQILAMEEAPCAFTAYWAGSASASVMHHYKRGAVHTINAGRKA